MMRSYSSLMVWLGLTIAASLALYHTSDRVNALNRQLRGLNAQIESEQESVHVLRAEWVYLSNPARIAAEAKGHLDLQPTAPGRVASLSDIGDLLPLRDGGEPTRPVREAAATPPPPAQIQPTRSVAHVTAPHTRYDRMIASINAGRINDHMIMEHSGAGDAPTDRIGALIDTLGLTQ